MESLASLVSGLDQLFRVQSYGKDPAMSRFVPSVYDSIAFPWYDFFEPGFCELFNGLMIKGEDEVRTVFLAVFPTDQVLRQFMDSAIPGDLLFMHHPLLMECGDPKGEWGRGFVPIEPALLRAVKDKGLSIYTCHVPMDYNKEIGTTSAICEALDGHRIDDFYRDEAGAVGAICKIAPVSTDELVAKLIRIFDIPYVDFEGRQLSTIHTIAVVAGCGDVVERMKEAEAKGAQAYVTGEIHCHVDNDYGRQRYKMMMDYVFTTRMSLIGVSHAASEYLVMKTQMKRWLAEHYDVQVKLLPQHKWWL